MRKNLTYASARSRLSLTTPVTPRIISRLSVASAKTRCAAWVAALVVGRNPMRVEDRGDDAREDTGVHTWERSGPPALRSLWYLVVRARLIDPEPPAAAPTAELAPGAPSAMPGAGLTLEVAQRWGKCKMKPLTRDRAGSGRALPAYLLTISTT
jgi:hypothetical protein